MYLHLNTLSSFTIEKLALSIAILVNIIIAVFIVSKLIDVKIDENRTRWYAHVRSQMSIMWEEVAFIYMSILTHYVISLVNKAREEGDDDVIEKNIRRRPKKIWSVCNMEDLKSVLWLQWM